MRLTIPWASNRVSADNRADPVRKPRGRARSKRTKALLNGSGLVILALVCLLAPLLPLRGPASMQLSARLTPPITSNATPIENILGTDQLGRSVLSRLLHSGRVSLLLAFASVSVAAAIGVVAGVTAGYYPRVFGAVVLRVADVFQSLPVLVMAITLVAVVGTSLVNLIVILALGRWVQFARIAYAQTLAMRSRDFVSAAVAIGAGDLRLIFRHILPNISSAAVVLGTVAIGQVIIAESALSFLGLGVPSNVPSWGSMLADGRDVLSRAWWLATFPGLMIMVVVLLSNGLGDALRDLWDPKER